MALAVLAAFSEFIRSFISFMNLGTHNMKPRFWVVTLAAICVALGGFPAPVTAAGEFAEEVPVENTENEKLEVETEATATPRRRFKFGSPISDRLYDKARPPTVSQRRSIRLRLPWPQAHNGSCCHLRV